MKKYYIYENESLLDEVIACSYEEALSTATKLYPKHNIFVLEKLL